MPRGGTPATGSHAQARRICTGQSYGGADSEPYESGDPWALPIRYIPARLPAVRMTGQARSHGSGSYGVDAHGHVAAGGTAPL